MSGSRYPGHFLLSSHLYSVHTAWQLKKRLWSLKSSLTTN